MIYAPCALIEAICMIDIFNMYLLNGRNKSWKDIDNNVLAYKYIVW